MDGGLHRILNLFEALRAVEQRLDFFLTAFRNTA